MSKPRLVNLLDDFALGGVSKGLGIFDSAPIRAVVDPSVVAIDGEAMIAPQLDAEIIVTHFPPNWRRLLFFATLKLRNPTARIIHVEHSYTRSWERLNVSNSRRFRTMLKLALHMVDQIVCVSAGQARWLSEASGIRSEKIDVIHPFSNNPGLDAVPAPDFSVPRSLRVGAYGRFHEAKGFDKLIAAWQAGAMPGTELLIGGFGEDEERLRGLAGGAPGITFVGKIDDVAGFLAKCDIVAVPSNWEAYGQVANEAREAGRPIMVSDVDGLPEQVGQAGLIVDFSSATDVAQAFGSLDSGKLTAMSKAGRRATLNCGPVRQQQWSDLLRRLLPTHARLRHRFAPA